ncbi:mucin-5AC-like [Vidua chalybeata]|uniref:mucin-5AC-like n=1 Tax=Vidua chalybeata TaxID=81927 RepID=UPI0023A8D885|nr:mucin-5AC-like [Vidua chalybeata]
MVMATKNTSAATKKALVGAVTTKKASLVAVTTKNTSVATQNPAVVAVTKNAMVVATTKNAAVVATTNTSVATKKALETTKNTSVVAMATKNTSAAIKNALVVVATTKEASAATKNTSVVVKTTKNILATTKNTSVVAMAPKNTPAATKNAMVVVTAKKALMTTKNTSVVVKATKNALETTKNISVVTMATKNTSAATKHALVVVATTKEASAATKNTSVVVVTNKATVLAITTNASLVATNTSIKGAEETTQTCQSFQCSGERCYQDGAHANRTTTCQNETHCELYRFSSTNYMARCSSGCSAEPCSTNGSRQQCALECCAGPLCLQLNASAYGDLPPTTTTAVPLTTTTTTPRPPPQNGKVCAAFSCHGDRCFKGRKTITRCILGQDFCEMKKMGLNYMAGCSEACKAAKPICGGGMKAACYQECCPATPKGSCLKLDGKVHINSAGQATLAPLLKVIACGVVLLLNYRVSTSLWG